MAKVKPIPDGCEGIIPHLVVQGGTKALDFYKNAFGAEEVSRIPSPDGRILHAELRIGSSPLYVADDFPEQCGGQSRHPLALNGTPATVHRYVNDVDGVIRRAQEAGATVKMPATDMFWGDRYGVVVDPFGHQWSFASRQKGLSPEEMRTAATRAFAQGPPKPQSAAPERSR